MQIPVEVPEGFGAAGEVPEGSGADTVLRFRWVPVQIAGEVLEGSGAGTR